MSLHKEISFEGEICDHLGAAGWIYEEGAGARYDRERALFPEDLRDWFTRIYAFLSQIFDYGSTEIEKRYMFYKRLTPLLQFGRERDGVDLSGVRLTHHNLKDEGARALQVGEDRPTLPPITGIGSGAVQEKEKALLAEIIAKVNDLFDGDLRARQQQLPEPRPPA
ncbi:hypothetical protein WKH79_02245 [Qipengyuania sp. GPGPB31]|uniref:hypothetical protein n=1 Tax=Qipengyuania sp. GPGPB31 TaxID=3023518 RepID=UPI00313427E3